MSNNKSVSIAFKRHDHERCSDSALKSAEDYCKRHNLQLTPTRRKVLELLLEAHRAIGAYSLLDLLKEAGARNIRFMCLLAAPEGVARMNEAHPDVPIITAAVDRQLNAKGYIVPGLGDAGDRMFGTK